MNSLAGPGAKLYVKLMDDVSLVRLGDLNYVEALREQGRATDSTIIERDGLVLITGPGSHPLYNYGVRADPRTGAREAFDTMRQHFAEVRHGFTLVTMNAHDDSGLAKLAVEEGLVQLLAPPAMFCLARLDERPLPDGCRLEWVRDAAGLDGFRNVSKIAWTTYGMDEQITARIFTRIDMVFSEHARAVVAYDARGPLSCALLLLSHGIAGVYWVGTTPAGRGRGFAEACTRAVTNLGFDCGARMVTLQASPMGDPIYRRMGYRQIGAYSLMFSFPPRP